ncbi:hypothetical protein [Defluviimonas sp. SAOS-178_SWC]|uniref:hypothetical protein n=1 Tax=Defluviimonas sp. SAOS-178_SWC TaxID=3121287 RepID=UPI003221D8AF
MADEAALVFALDARIVKMERALAKAEARAAAAGRKIETEFQKANKKVTDGLTQSATGLARLGNVTGAQRFVIQNTANQFGDLAVQIAGGTTVMRAMSQQAPQLLGGLGALGGTLGTLGPLMGVVAAIGLPLAAVFFNMAMGSEEAADKAETLEDKVKNLSSAVKDYASAADLALKGTADLKDEYGSLANEAQRALDIQERLKRNAAERQIADVASGVGAQFGSLDAVTRDAGGATAYEEALRRIREDLDLTGADAVLVAQALQSVLSATDTAGRVEAFKGLRDTLVSVYGSLEAADQATGGLVTRLNDSVIGGQRLLAEVEKIAGAAINIGAAIDAATTAFGHAQTAAAGFADTIRDAARAAWDLAQQRIAAEDRLQELSFGNSPGGQALNAYGGRTPGGNAAQQSLASRNAPKKVSSRGGVGGRTINAEEAADLAKVKALYASTRTELERYNEEKATLVRLLKEGKIGQDLYNRALADLNENLQSQKLDSFKNGILDIASGARTAGDAFDALKESIKRALLEYVFFGSGPLTGGGGLGGILGRVIGGAFGVPSADGGGYTGSGIRAGGLDGKGGFMAMVHPRETIIDHTKGGGGGGGVDVRVFFDDNGALQAKIERVSGAVSAAQIGQFSKQAREAQRRR